MKTRRKKEEITSLSKKVNKLLIEGFTINCIQKILDIRKDLLSNIISRLVAERKIDLSRIEFRIVSSDTRVGNITAGDKIEFYEIDTDPR